MEIRQITYFLRACDYGSIAAAADNLGTAPSNVSLQIKQLEHELGIDLCRRSNTGLSLTDAGERFYRIAQGLDDDVAFLSRYARSSLAVAPVRIGLAVPFAPRGSVMAEVLRIVSGRLGERHPHVHLRSFAASAGSPFAGDEAQVVVGAWDGSDPGHPHQVRDRWALVGRRGEVELPTGEVPASTLVEVASRVRLVLPAMPPGLTAQAREFVGTVGAAVADDIATGSLEAVEVEANKVVLLPLSCVPGFARQQRFQISYAGSQSSDPCWSIQGLDGGSGSFVNEASELFGVVLGGALRGLREAAPEPEPDGRPGRSPPPPGEVSPLSFRQLKAFDAAFERGNVSRAAADLNVSQPALSNTLKALEGSIGHRLFLRTAHGVQPTAKAVALRALCEPLLQDSTRARSQLRELAKRGPAPLRVGILPVLDDESLLAVTIADAIDEWSRSTKGCELKLTEGYSAPLRRWTVQELLDFAIVDNEARQSGLLVTPLSRDSMVVVTDPRFDVLRPGPVKARDVVGLDLILPSERHGVRGIVNRAFAEARMTVLPKLELDSMAMTLNLLRMDAWATILPVSAISKRAEAGELQVNLITEPAVDRSLSLVRRTGSQPSPEAIRFIEMLAARIREAVSSQRRLLRADLDVDGDHGVRER